MPVPNAYEADSNEVASHLSTASVNDVVLVEGPCRFVGANYNGAGTARWIKFYDLARAPLTSDEPIIKFRTTVNAPTMTPVPDGGIWCVNGLAIRITVNVGESDDTAITAGEVGLRAYYSRR